MAPNIVANESTIDLDGYSDNECMTNSFDTGSFTFDQGSLAITHSHSNEKCGGVEIIIIAQRNLLIEL